MFHLRSSALIALTLCGLSAVALAQTQPQASDPQTSPPRASSADSMPSSEDSATVPSNSATSAKDPKLNACVHSEKAKNSGLSDNQIKQKCMLQIAGQQGKGQ